MALVQSPFPNISFCLFLNRPLTKFSSSLKEEIYKLKSDNERLNSELKLKIEEKYQTSNI